MKYIPVDVFDCVSENLDLTSIIQLGRTCRDTKFFATRANDFVTKKSNSTIKTIVCEMIKVFDILQNVQLRDHICRGIARNVMQSAIQTSIIDTICMSCYEHTRIIFNRETVAETLEKVEKKMVLSNADQQIWNLFQQFWLGNSFYISIFMTSVACKSDVLLQMHTNATINVTIMKSGEETISSDFHVDNVNEMVSFIWTNCSKKFMLDASIVSSQVIRQHNVAKTPNSFDRLYHVYLHIKEVQHPFFQVVEEMNKKIMH